MMLVDAMLEQMDVRDIAAMAATRQADELATLREQAAGLRAVLTVLDDVIPGIVDAWESCEDGAVVAIRVLEWAADDAHRENEILEAELLGAQTELRELRQLREGTAK